jgi:ADP-heptose:LPS heptosyltransferase
MLNLQTERINSEYFSIFKQLPVMLKLHLKRKKTKANRTKRVLIINNTLIGDFLTSLPAMKQFIDQNKADVDLVVSPIMEPLAKHIIGVKKVFTAKSTYKRDTEQTKRDGKKFSNYDQVLIMQTSGDTYHMLKNVNYNKIKTSVLPYLKYGIYVSKNLSKKHNIKQHEEFSFEITKAPQKRFEFDELFKFNKKDYRKAKEMSFIKNKNCKKVVIHTGSGWYVKLWKNERWIKLLNKINERGKFKFIFVGGTEKEESDFKHIKGRLDFEVYSAIKKMNIKELALMMRECDYFIGVDSGPRHIAHLLNMPSICLMGPGPKIFSPKNRNAIMIDKSDCYCTNLFCYRKKPCVEKISVNDVMSEFDKIAK